MILQSSTRWTLIVLFYGFSAEFLKRVRFATNSLELAQVLGKRFVFLSKSHALLSLRGLSSLIPRRIGIEHRQDH